MSRRRSRKLLKKNMYLVIGLVMVGIIIYMIGTNTSISGIDFTVLSQSYFKLFPSMLLFIFGIWALFGIRKSRNNVNEYLKNGIFGVVCGLSFSLMLAVMNDNSIYIDDILTATFTITDLQIMVTVLWVLLGVIWSVIR